MLECKPVVVKIKEEKKKWWVQKERDEKKGDWSFLDVLSKYSTTKLEGIERPPEKEKKTEQR